MRAAFFTLGCKVNQYETQALEQLLERRGHTVVPFSGDADAYIVNTCSVTAASDQKSRQAVRRVRREHPGAVVAVCGCYPQTHALDARQLDADLIAGTGDRTGFITLLEQAVERKSRPVLEQAPKIPSRQQVEAVDQALSRRDFEVLPAGRLEGRTRAMLKVEDGCANFCAYCVIPYARGPVRSAPLQTAVEQATALAAEGVKEIVITGIELSCWGRDLKSGQDLKDLIEAVCAAVSDTRIRLGSLEPRTVTEDFCRRTAVLSNLCPQFHLSLQSGCDETLRRMRRKYDTKRYRESVSLLRRWFDHPAVTTDLITGFPEETEEEFARTLAFLRHCAFARVHVFPYSARPGTPAASMPQVPRAVREARAKAAAAVAAETRAAYLAACVGACYPVLFERSGNGQATGHAPNYAEVTVDSGEPLRDTVRAVRIVRSDGTRLYGVIE